MKKPLNKLYALEAFLVLAIVFILLWPSAWLFLVVLVLGGSWLGRVIWRSNPKKKTVPAKTAQQPENWAAQKWVTFLVCSFSFLWIVVLFWYQPEVDPGGPLFMMGASLFLLLVPFWILIGCCWLLWSFFRRR